MKEGAVRVTQARTRSRSKRGFEGSSQALEVKAEAEAGDTASAAEEGKAPAVARGQQVTSESRVGRQLRSGRGRSNWRTGRGLGRRDDAGITSRSGGKHKGTGRRCRATGQSRRRHRGEGAIEEVRGAAGDGRSDG